MLQIMGIRIALRCTGVSQPPNGDPRLLPAHVPLHTFVFTANMLCSNL